jgi:hypothetical protein
MFLKTGSGWLRSPSGDRGFPTVQSKALLFRSSGLVARGGPISDRSGFGQFVLFG